LGRFYPVPILVSIFVVLYIVEYDEQVGALYFMYIAKPGQIMQLMNANDHVQGLSMVFRSKSFWAHTRPADPNLMLPEYFIDGNGGLLNNPQQYDR
tara:strand:- start:706 stop:993 length:288 start_codon:yes stop_codon:yes gene_type:complete